MGGADTPGDPRIAEIRSCHDNHRLADPANRELRGVPCAERGYAGGGAAEEDER